MGPRDNTRTRRVDGDDDDDAPNPLRGRSRDRDEDSMSARALRLVDKEDDAAGVQRGPAAKNDARVVVLFLQNSSPYKADEIAAVAVAFAREAVAQGFCEVLSDRPAPRLKTRDWINNQPKHNATGGVAAGPASSGDLAALAKHVATAAQTAALQEEVTSLTATVKQRDDMIKDLGDRLSALEAKQPKK